jgi:tetratricopeptide (TPR) repeat protein
LLVERQPRTSQPPEYDFTHETLHNVVYAGTSLARRRLLHRRTAEALAASRRGELDAQASQIARHYQFAGREPEAADYFRRAGDYASRLYANTEALAHYRAALALHHPHPALHEAIGDLLTLRGEYRAAVLSYENAASLSGEEHLPQLELKLGNLHHRRGDYDLAGSHFAAALDLLADSNPALRAQILIDWSRTAAQQGDAPRGCDLAQRGLQLAAAESAAGALGQAHNILGIIARRERDFPTARAHLQRALEISGANPFARVAALNNLALVLADEAQYDEAIRLAGEALETCTRLGDRHREAALRNHLADFHHAAGDRLQALRCLRAAVEIFAEIGVDAGDLQPEIWKLTEW